MNEQELFWKNIYGKNYINKNYNFDDDKGSKVWKDY